MLAAGAAGEAALWRQDAAAAAAELQSAAEILADECRRGYDVICLPVILWNSRFQRPQQLMDQFARRGHRVFYASLGFCGGKDGAAFAAAAGLFEMTLPGTPGMNVYRELPSEADVARMADAIDRLRIDGRLASAVRRRAIALLDRAGRAAARAVRLADGLRLHGRPLRLLDELRVDAAGGRPHDRRRPIWSWSPPICSRRRSARRPGARR